MAPRTAKQFREMREEKMSEIMDVALIHFANDGFFRTTISHLAKEAGMSKGLLYNYFESKEALLKAIIHRSVNEIYLFLDVNRDGILTADEFDYFIRKINALLKAKKSFWLLLMQLLLQNDVRERFLNAFPESDSLIHPSHIPGDNLHVVQMSRMVKNYFHTKKLKYGGNYDADAEFNMFVITLTGFVITSIYSGEKDDEKNERMLNQIINQYK